MNPQEITDLLKKLFLGKVENEVNVDTLTSLYNFLGGHLCALDSNPVSKLELMLRVFPLLKNFMEIPLWQTHFSKVGALGARATLLIIYRDFEDFSRSFSEQLNQMRYEEVKKSFSSTGFPEELTGLPGFFRTNLNDNLAKMMK